MWRRSRASVTDFALSDLSSPALHASVALVLLLIATAVGVYKPLGLIHYGTRVVVPGDATIASADRTVSWTPYLVIGVIAFFLLLIVLHVLGGGAHGRVVLTVGAVRPALVALGPAIPPGEILLEEYSSRSARSGRSSPTSRRLAESVERNCSREARHHCGYGASTRKLLKTSPQLWMRLQADWDLDQAMRREARKARAARRGGSLSPGTVEECTCQDGCFGQPACLETCGCRCEPSWVRTPPGRRSPSWRRLRW